MAGLKQVPVIIKDISETNLLQLSIIENIQRENLNPMEEADAYQRLMDDFGLTQEEIARHVGKSRSAVANFLRLLNLSDQIKSSIRERIISMGHARALLGAENAVQQRAAFRQVLSKGISVRQTEALIKRLKSKKQTPQKPEKNQTDRYLSSLSEELSRHFGTKVAIKRKGQKGTVEIEFYSDDDLDRLISLLNRS
jgi:ParB family chromosome partitioning protein